MRTTTSKKRSQLSYRRVLKENNWLTNNYLLKKNRLGREAEGPSVLSLLVGRYSPGAMMRSAPVGSSTAHWGHPQGRSAALVFAAAGSSARDVKGEQKTPNLTSPTVPYQDEPSHSEEIGNGKDMTPFKCSHRIPLSV